MKKLIVNLFLYISILFFTNGCSTISETINLAGIVDKTEELFFGKDEDDNDAEESSSKEVSIDEKYSDEDISEIPDIEDIPTEKPEFSDIEKDFFEGEMDLEEGEKNVKVVAEAARNESFKEKTVEENNIRKISSISENVRIRVRMLMFNSDPPTKSDGKKISYQNEELKIPAYIEENKIAVFYFPNNSIVPDLKAESVINEIVKIYKNSSLIIVGHASSLGGTNPSGKKINMNISFARADAIKNMLVKNGFEKTKIRTIGKGDLEPIINANDEIIESENRRVEVFLLSN